MNKTILLLIIAFIILIPIVVILILGLFLPFYKILYYHHISNWTSIITLWIGYVKWEFLSAIGTVTAAIIAIFHETFWKWWRRPKLSFLMKTKEPYFINIPQSTDKKTIFGVEVGNNPNGNAIYSRLRVQNVGKSVARNVSVSIQEIRGSNIYGNYICHKIDMHLNLENIGVERNQFPNIQSQKWCYWDFFIIADPEYRKNYKEYMNWEKLNNKDRQSEPALVICLTYKLAVDNHILDPGNYEVDILITCDELSAIKKTILIDTSQLTEWPKKIAFNNREEKRKKEENEIRKQIKMKIKHENYSIWNN